MSGPGSLPLPAGFSAYTGRIGLRAEGDDVWVVLGQPGTTCAAVFTKSRFAGPSVTVSRAHLATGRPRAAVVVAKNANVATGDPGRRDAEEVAALVAAAAGTAPEDVLVASTGVIGRRYPMDAVRSHLQALPPVPAWHAGPSDLARAMMTTDTHPKVAARPAGGAQVVGVAKGVGMIEPDMATMLAFVFTDAEVETATLDRLWRRAVERTFNCLSVDSDTSTSDSAVVFASGVAGPVDEIVLSQALSEVCLDLTLQLARDGEGATKLLTVTVSSARDDDQARRVAKAVLNSPLVKTAVHGADPNWGRVAMAVGKCSDDTDIDQDQVVIRFGDMETYPTDPGPEGLSRLRAIMAADHVDIEIDLGIAYGSATVYGCDLSDGYVRINADYTT
ncbi:bifunctional glutamate N-acetyltransferase/amino-acid acetyltransferase ArgJ [Acidiferrimicrobium sp. IK]|uniref:bifunctional glutamate N-acetyltransferase/amino-acid acetyltransferase ArgJ n=1 Tax=Acidiferrimicrobium sp. IK TaxID=2871700 RepID=UPI003967C5FC